MLPPATICDACAAPKTTAPPTPAAATKSAPGLVATAIPSKNVPALVSYYCGLFSVIPYAGMVLAPTAIVCGIVGLRRPPEQRGKAHAVVGIVAAIVLGAVGHYFRGRFGEIWAERFGSR